MKMGATRVLLAACALLVACAAAPMGQAEPVVRAAAEGAGNSVEAQVAGRALTVDVWSARGIGAASVELAGGSAPDAVLLRLHLRALEELRLTYGQAEIVASLASGPGHAVSQRRVLPNSEEQPLSPGDPGWMEIQVVSAEPDPPFPLREGHIAVTLPADVLAGDEGVFSVRWVDMFR